MCLEFQNVQLSVSFSYKRFSFHRFRQFFGGINFDRNIDNVAGGGSIHITPGVVFQEMIEGARKETFNINIEKRKGDR